MVEGTQKDERAALGLVACGSFRDELEAVLRQEGLSLPLFYLAPAPCLDYSSLEAQLSRLLERARGRCERVVVAIGRCHPDMEAILARHPAAPRLPMDNCFDALLGGRSRELAQAVNTFFTTPAWLRHWRRFAKRQGWEEVEVRQNFGLYERILLLDAGVTPYAEEEVLALFDATGVPVEVWPISLDELTRLLLDGLRTKPGN